jgi:uncharacterized protein (DUF2062 family)
MKDKLKKALSPKYYLDKLLQLKDRPDEAARGLAIGVFIGFLPIIGFQVIVAVTISLFVRASKVAAAVGTHVTNPWTTLPILVLDYYVGCLVLGRHACLPNLNLSSFHSLLACGKEILVPMFVGGVLLGTLCSVLSYFGMKRLLQKKFEQMRELMERERVID